MGSELNVGEAIAEKVSVFKNGADAFISFGDNSVNWAVGIDQSESQFQINKTSVMGSNQVLTLDSSGNVKIGDGSLAAIGGGPTLGMVGAAPEITLRDTATGTPYAWIATNDSGNLVLAADEGETAASSKISFKVDGDEQATIDSTGLATFSAGIALSGGHLKLGGFNALTVASSAITITSNVHQVDNDGSSNPVDLDTINGGDTGTILILRSLTGGRDTKLKDGEDNLFLNGDFTLASSHDTITLVKVGSNWQEISRSTNF